VTGAGSAKSALDQAHHGRVAVITGGGRGFGRAFGTALAARGAHVVLADIDAGAAEAAANEITDNGGSASGAACDVADEAAVAAMIDQVTTEHGGIDILVNNAGLHSAAYANRAAYGVSKLAVRGVTVQLAREFAADGIRVNAIAPGLIFTDTIRAELGRDETTRVMAQQILPREGEERDIVDALLFLVSPAASFVTGETLRVSGGFALSV
jgi:3-oxoacyl-[acyl-carrier protein] reductase